MPETTIDRAAPVFVARALTKVYQMGEVRVDALRGIDFELFPGEFVVLLGPSGSGKSTLLNILGGLDVPTSGEVIYHDSNLTTAGDAALTAYRRTHVGSVLGTGQEAEVVSGLSEGTHVVLHPGDTLTDGGRVKEKAT